MTHEERKPYSGTSRRLIISIDVGTTFTAASFCILQPGKVPKFEEILRWPKQATPDAKVPSVLYYDKHGNACAFGAETEDEDIIIQAESEEWYKTAWWKLWLRPEHLPMIRGLTLPPLPTGKTVDDIFTDHLRYIKDQIKNYIISTYGEGDNIWTTLYPSLYCILTTPNGWEGRQQSRMRSAAINAGLVDENGSRRVRFVSEAEAAVLYAVDSGTVSEWLVRDGSLILCDCGGGTIDVTGYTVKSLKPLKLEESAASRCYLAGAVFVTQAAKDFIRNKLTGTEWDNPDALPRAVQHFDRNAKKKFEDPNLVSWVQLDGYRSVPHLGITRGRLRITGEEMESFFEEPFKKIIEGLEIAFENGHRLADKVILVGGLASSPYVYSKLLKWGKEFGISVSRPDGPTVKAVANGALAWHIDDTVSSRMARFHYGIQVNDLYEETDEETEGRVPIEGLDGCLRVDYAWSSIIKKNQPISTGKEFFEPYVLMFEESSIEFDHSANIMVYRRAKPPKFVTFPGRCIYQPGFEVLCTVSGNLKQCFRISPRRIAPNGQRYRSVAFEIGVTLGDTEVAARMHWKGLQGEYHYGLAQIVYD